MANPVMDALVGMRLKEEPTAFGKWCITRNVRALPALPQHVAAFITDLAAAEKSVKQIWPLVQEISRTHVSQNFADPTAGGVVAEMINSLSMIAPPRSWPKEEWSKFKQLPYDLQLFYSKREGQRDTAVLRAQNEAAAARREAADLRLQLDAAIKKSTETTDEKQPETTRAA